MFMQYSFLLLTVYANSGSKRRNLSSWQSTMKGFQLLSANFQVETIPKGKRQIRQFSVSAGIAFLNASC